MTTRRLTAREHQALRRRAAVRRVALRRKPAPYRDRLLARGRQLAARALAADLAVIKRELEQAASYPELRARIVTQHRHMKPDALADVLAKTNLLAHLSGRLDATKEA